MKMLMTASNIKKARMTKGQVFFGTCCKWYNKPEIMAPAKANA